jgi:hypothetical protein
MPMEMIGLDGGSRGKRFLKFERFERFGRFLMFERFVMFVMFKRLEISVCRCWCYHQSSKEGGVEHFQPL